MSVNEVSVKMTPHMYDAVQAVRDVAVDTYTRARDGLTPAEVLETVVQIVGHVGVVTDAPQLLEELRQYPRGAVQAVATAVVDIVFDILEAE